MTGFICLHKPTGITSFSAVAKVRKIYGEKKCGHCGTLDPMATGVLPVMMGGATRFLEFLPDTNKRYTAVMRLGLTTDTLDITGKVTSENIVTATFSDVVNAAEKYKGNIMQIPPMYSAVKKDGLRMYDLARKGIEVEREPRPVTIYRLDVYDGNACENKLQENEYMLDIECSSGTYIRTLIDDIGKDLGCGAVMSKLMRTCAAGFDIQDSVTLEELEMSEKTSLDKYVRSVDEVLSIYPAVFVTAAQAKRFINGGGLSLERTKGCKASGLYRVYSPENVFLGIGSAEFDKGMLSVKRVYVGR